MADSSAAGRASKASKPAERREPAQRRASDAAGEPEGPSPSDTNERAECVILVGLPGAGKSTYARRHLPSHEYISKDAFPPSAKDKQRRQEALLRAALAAGRSVVVDNTNPTPADRAAIIAVARELGARVTGIYIEVTTREAIARNAGRAGRARVPNVAIFTCAKRLVPPVLGEGFDALHTVRVPPASAP